MLLFTQKNTNCLIESKDYGLVLCLRLYLQSLHPSWADNINSLCVWERERLPSVVAGALWEGLLQQELGFFFCSKLTLRSAQLETLNLSLGKSVILYRFTWAMMNVCHCSRGISDRSWLLHIKNVKIRWTAHSQYVGLKMTSSWYSAWTGATPWFELCVSQSSLLLKFCFLRVIHHSLVINKILFWWILSSYLNSSSYGKRKKSHMHTHTKPNPFTFKVFIILPRRYTDLICIWVQQSPQYSFDEVLKYTADSQNIEMYICSLLFFLW